MWHARLYLIEENYGQLCDSFAEHCQFYRFVTSFLGEHAIYANFKVYSKDFEFAFLNSSNIVFYIIERIPFLSKTSVCGRVSYYKSMKVHLKDIKLTTLIFIPILDCLATLIKMSNKKINCNVKFSPKKCLILSKLLRV